MSFLVDLAKALGQLNDPRFLRVLWKGLAATMLGLAAFLAAVWFGLGWLLPDVIRLPWLGEVGVADDLAFWAAMLAAFLLSALLMMPVAGAVIGFFLDEAAAAVEARHYPGLPAARRPALGEQARDAARFFLVFVAANLAGLVVYLGAPVFAPFVFFAVNGFLLGRECFQLVAARRMTPAKAAALYGAHRLRIWAIGVLMAAPLSVPGVNLLAPLLGAAVYTHQFHRMARRSPAQNR